MNFVADKVRAGDYNTKLPYPRKPSKPALPKGATAAQARAYATEMDAYELDMVSFHAVRDAYHADQNALYAQFRKDLEDENGMTGHPKADLLYAKAWDRGHSSGLGEVALVYDDLVELVK